jgi:branched-chain amino acid transport system ATP-binding protein
MAQRTTGALSHGDKRKLELAILLAAEAKVLLLDEPMAGVNSEDVPMLSSLIGRLHGEGRTVLMVEHHMAVVIGLAENVAVLNYGRLLACGDPETVMADETVQSAYLGDPL